MMKLSVNRAVVNKSKDWEILATRFVNEELSLDELAKEVNEGHAFSTQHKGRRQQTNFIASGYVALDFDRNDPEDIDEIFSDQVVSSYYGLFYHTFSSTQAVPKFRIVFELEQPIYDADYYREAVTAFIWKFAANADETCKDPCRLFYGSKDSKPTFTNNILPMPVVAKIKKAHQQYLEQEKKDREAADYERRKLLTPAGGNSEKGKKAFLEKVLERHCERIRQAPKGERHHTLRNSARVLGGYLQGEPGLISEIDIRQRLEAAYSTHENLNRREMLQTIEWGINHGKNNPLYIPEIPKHDNLIDFTEWSGQSNVKTNVDIETGEVLESNEGSSEPKIETFNYFPLYTFEELANLPKPSWLIEPILVRGYLTCVYGPTQTAKSFLMLDLALQVAAAGYKVIYVIAENANGYHARANSWYQYHEQLPNDNIRFIPMPVSLLLPEQVYRIEKTIDDFYGEVPPSFVIFDTLSRCFTGGDENDTKDMQSFVTACDKLRRKYNATIGVVHHSPKVGGSPRGSSVITGDFDTIIETAKKVDSDQKLITVKCEKQKDAKEFTTRLYRLQTTGELFDFEDSCVLVEENENGNTGNASGQDRLPTLGYTILETLNQSAIESEGLTSYKLMNVLEIDPKTEKSAKAIFFRILSRLVDLKLVNKIMTARNPVFKITISGKDYLKPQDLL